MIANGKAIVGLLVKPRCRVAGSYVWAALMFHPFKIIQAYISRGPYYHPEHAAIGVSSSPPLMGGALCRSSRQPSTLRWFQRNPSDASPA